MQRPTWTVAVLIAAGCAIASLPAQTHGEWRVVPSVTAPPARTGFSLVTLADGRLLLFGGDVANPSATEWRWDGFDWRPQNLTVPRRSGAGLTRDGIGRVWIYGGNGATGALGDIWVQDQASLSPLVPLFFNQFIAPPVLVQQPSLAYDANTDRIVLVGSNGLGQFETWFRPAGVPIWTQGDTFTAASAALLTDATRGDVTLFRNDVASLAAFRLVGEHWQPLVQTTFPQDAADLAFDPGRGLGLLLQPFSDRPVLGWDGLSFALPPAATGSYVPPVQTAVGYDGIKHDVLLVALEGASLTTRRWVEEPEPAAWSQGSSCGPGITFGLLSGDQPQIGGSHRLQANGTTGSFATLCVLGTSHTEYGGLPLPLPLPLGTANCLLRVEALAVNAIGVGLPATQLVPVPNSPLLLGERYDAQAITFDAAGVRGSSAGLEVQLGLPSQEFEFVEAFDDASNRDPQYSSDTWGGGRVTPGQIGGDGRHGSFDPTLGTSLGGGVYEWDVDNIALLNQITGLVEPIVQGRFFFYEFFLPAGVTVRFTGSVPPVITVCGPIDIQGTLEVNGGDLPRTQGIGLAASQQISTFNARGGVTSPAPFVLGQPGTRGGAGGGRGGKGGDECQNSGPQFVGGINLNDGQPGEDVHAPNHAYSAQGTGGRGGLMVFPAGVWTPTTYTVPSTQLILSQFMTHFSRGGSGGGYLTAGDAPAVPTIAGTIPIRDEAFYTVISPATVPAVPGIAFPIHPYPAAPPNGYSSLAHYLIGGSGGGGGGCHGFALSDTNVNIDKWMAGHGGTGGGGAVALRSGNTITVGGTGLLQARGGRGVWISGHDPNGAVSQANFGISSPGGGGSGGSFLLQAAAGITMNGTIDTSGGTGSQTGLAFLTQLSVQARGGDGADGFYRLEVPAGKPFSFAPSGTCVPTFVASDGQGERNRGTLLDSDARTSSTSVWLLPQSAGLPVYLRYELLVLVDGLPVLLSDDPTVSPLAAGVTAPVQALFQGARLDPLTGGPVVGSVGSWRSTLTVGTDSLNRDRAQLVRFRLVLDKTFGTVEVDRLRLVYR